MSCERREDELHGKGSWGRTNICKKGWGEGENQVKRGRVVHLCQSCVWSGDTRFLGFLVFPAGSVLGCRTRQTPEAQREGPDPGMGAGRGCGGGPQQMLGSAAAAACEQARRAGNNNQTAERREMVLIERGWASAGAGKRLQAGLRGAPINAQDLGKCSFRL